MVFRKKKFSDGSNTGKIFRRRIPLILLHLVAWAIFVFYPFIFFRIRVFDTEFYYKQFINTAFLAGIFYFTSYYIFPRLLKKVHLFRNIALLLALTAFIPLQQYLLEYHFFKRIEARQLQIISPLSKVKIAEFHSSTTRETSRKEIRVIVRKDSLSPGDHFFQVPLPVHRIFFNETLQTSISSVLFVLMVSGFMSVMGELFRTEKKRKELENQRLNAELAFLKSQVNPHFFFNTLNTIYYLARKKSDQTEQVVVKLSEIMRYMIYESNATVVDLQKEISYLGDYIDLQKLRLSKKIDVRFEVTGNAENLFIAPMMLIPFVENSFKHGISYAEESFINIEIAIHDSILEFRTRNKTFVKKDDIEEPNGVGLQNVKKRLAMIYPGRHSLSIETENKEFAVKLIIQLKDD